MKPVDGVKVRRVRTYPKERHEATHIKRAARARELGGMPRFRGVMAAFFARPGK